jgi:hypothetical protein
MGQQGFFGSYFFLDGGGRVSKLKLVTKRGVGDQQKKRLEDLDHEIEEAILDRDRKCQFLLQY